MNSRWNRQSRKYAPWRLLAITMPLLAAPASVRAANPGDTGLAFLKIGVGARATAMGEAYVAVAQEPTALYWNPAGIANQRGVELHATHNEWISDVRYEYLAFTRGGRGQAFGVHVALLHMGALDRRDDTGAFLGTFRAYDLSTGLTYARRVSKSFELGLTGKVLYSKIEDHDAIGFAGDGGVRYRTPVLGLTLAAAVSNLGTSMTFIDDSFILPVSARFGAAYRTKNLLSGLIVSGDLRFPNDSSTKSHLGVEVWPHEMVALRGGAKFGYDEELGAFGFGLKYRTFLFDYAYAPFTSTSELGDTHRISLGWRPPDPEPAAN